MAATKVLGIRLTDEERSRVDEAARRAGKTPSAWAKDVVERALGDGSGQVLGTGQRRGSPRGGQGPAVRQNAPTTPGVGAPGSAVRSRSKKDAYLASRAKDAPS